MTTAKNVCYNPGGTGWGYSAVPPPTPPPPEFPPPPGDSLVTDGRFLAYSIRRRMVSTHTGPIMQLANFGATVVRDVEFDPVSGFVDIEPVLSEFLGAGVTQVYVIRIFNQGDITNYGPLESSNQFQEIYFPFAIHTLGEWNVCQYLDGGTYEFTTLWVPEKLTCLTGYISHLMLEAASTQRMVTSSTLAPLPTEVGSGAGVISMALMGGIQTTGGGVQTTTFGEPIDSSSPEPIHVERVYRVGDNFGMGREDYGALNNQPEQASGPRVSRSGIYVSGRDPVLDERYSDYILYETATGPTEVGRYVRAPFSDTNDNPSVDFGGPAIGGTGNFRITMPFTEWFAIFGDTGTYNANEVRVNAARASEIAASMILT